MKITCWIWEQAPPYCMALPHRYFIFALNLPVNQQRPVIRKSKKALGVCNEQKCHTLEHGEKTLRNCGSLTKLTVTSTPPSRPRVASIRITAHWHKPDSNAPFLRTMFYAICFLITVFFRLVFFNGSRLECNKKETILNVLWHFIVKKWKIFFLSVFCVHPCK